MAAAPEAEELAAENELRVDVSGEGRYHRSRAFTDKMAMGSICQIMDKA